MSQVESCYEELRQLIVTCEIPPGTRLNEKALIERLGYGRTPVREALLRLNHDRLVEVRQRSGYIVRPVTRKSVADLLAVWSEIIPLLMTLAMPKMTAEARAASIALVEDQGERVRNDPIRSLAITRQLFDTLVELADNEPLAYVYRNLIADLERISIVLFYLPHGRQWAGGAEVIASFLKESDPAVAGEKARARVRESSEALFAFLEQQPDHELHFPVRR